MSDSLWPYGLYSLPGSSVHWISQTRILEWDAISFSRGSSRSRDRTLVSCIAGRSHQGSDLDGSAIWATREADNAIKSTNFIKSQPLNRHFFNILYEEIRTLQKALLLHINIWESTTPYKEQPICHLSMKISETIQRQDRVFYAEKSPPLVYEVEKEKTSLQFLWLTRQGIIPGI